MFQPDIFANRCYYYFKMIDKCETKKYKDIADKCKKVLKTKH
jgi:hypothetical protein